jgi:dihydrofolate reductase
VGALTGVSNGQVCCGAFSDPRARAAGTRNELIAPATPVIYGHGPLGQTLLENGLLDEIRLSVHPIIVASGTLFFRQAKQKAPLKLVDSQSLASGVVVLTYAERV